MTLNRWTRSAALVIAGLVFLAGSTWALQVFFTRHYPGANDFYARWRPARAWLLEGLGPYSEAATRATQVGMYGRPALPTEDQALFSYPLFSMLFFVGPALISDYSLASALWMAGVLLALLLLWFFSLDWADWRPPPWLWGLTLLFGLLWYHPLRTLILGQFAALNALSLLGALLLLRAGREARAGILLALTASKPQMTFLLIPALLLWACSARRWRFITASGLTFGLLLLGSLAARPTWIGEWWQQLSVYVDHSVNAPPAYVLAAWFGPTAAPGIQFLISGLLLVFWSGALWRSRGALGPDWEWAVGLTLVVTCWIAPRTATTDFVMMTPALFWLFGTWQRRYGARGQMGVALLEVMLGIGVWVLFAATVQGDQEHAWLYLPWPTVMLVGFLITPP